MQEIRYLDKLIDELAREKPWKKFYGSKGIILEETREELYSSRASLLLFRIFLMLCRCSK